MSMAKTVGQLETVLGHYIPSEESFVQALNLCLPRLFALGNWRDLVVEKSITTDHSYISLERGHESLLAGMVDGYPTDTSSRWQDYVTQGLYNSSGPAPIFGLVDDGTHPVEIDLAEGDDDNDEYDFKVTSIEPGVAAVPASGKVHIIYEGADGTDRVETFELDGSASMSTAYTTEVDAAKQIQSIRFENVPTMIQIQAVPLTVAGTTFRLTTGRGNEVAEHRRYRFYFDSVSATKTVTVLIRRKFIDLMNQTDIVPLGSYDLIKNALLAHVAEDNANLDDAERHWAYCLRILEGEMAAYRGSIRPKINLQPYGPGSTGTTNPI